jgi:hypothetical protein
MWRPLCPVWIAILLAALGIEENRQRRRQCYAGVCSKCVPVLGAEPGDKSRPCIRPYTRGAVCLVVPGEAPQWVGNGWVVLRRVIAMGT